MVKKSCVLKVVTYSALVQGFCEEGRTTDARWFLKQWRVVLSQMLLFWCEMKRIRDVLKVFKQSER